MNVELVPIDSLHLDPANARRHPDKNLAAIKASLARFGQQKPIVADTNGIVRAGNGTLAAAKELGWVEIAVVRTPLAGSEATAFAIADNRTAELAEWDFESLADTIRALQEEDFDLTALGWSEHELEPLLAASWEPPPLENLPESPTGGTSDDGADPDLYVITVPGSCITEVVATLRAVREETGESAWTDGECVVELCRRHVAQAV